MMYWIHMITKIKMYRNRWIRLVELKIFFSFYFPDFLKMIYFSNKKLKSVPQNPIAHSQPKPRE